MIGECLSMSDSTKERNHKQVKVKFVPDWHEPDKEQPYMAGDKVLHAGYVWVSQINYNTFEPGTMMGWKIDM